MTEACLIAHAFEAGFAGAAVVGTEDIVFDASFRRYCEENLCGQYGANYSCPPDCGTPEEMKQRIMAHKKALVVQSVWEIADYSDIPAIKNAKDSHNAAALRLLKGLREKGCDGLLVGASSCSLCAPCAITKGESCKFPQLKFSCMSAYCIFVKKLAERCGMVYDCGAGKLAFFGLYACD